MDPNTANIERAFQLAHSMRPEFYAAPGPPAISMLAAIIFPLAEMTSTMVDTSSDPIPEELRQAFNEAVAQYSYWNRGGPEPEIVFHRALWKISAVCSLVTKFDDPMADNIYRYLCGQTDSLSKLLQEDRSFRSGARFLAGLIQERKAQCEPNRKQ